MQYRKPLLTLLFNVLAYVPLVWIWLSIWCNNQYKQQYLLFQKKKRVYILFYVIASSIWYKYTCKQKNTKYYKTIFYFLLLLIRNTYQWHFKNQMVLKHELHTSIKTVVLSKRLRFFSFLENLEHDQISVNNINIFIA